MDTKDQNIIWDRGYMLILFVLAINVSGRVNRISIAENMATTPPNLFGMDRRIAYAHKKYHSGLI